jgi:hypothetical protein
MNVNALLGGQAIAARQTLTTVTLMMQMVHVILLAVAHVLIAIQPLLVPVSWASQVPTAPYVLMNVKVHRVQTMALA